MDISSLLSYTLNKTFETFSHNWGLLLISILVSAALKIYVDQDAMARILRRNSRNSVLMSTGVAVTTPFCSCGTTAVILGMMTSTVPWAPIVAFMVSSPLTSPQELFYSAGLFGWTFAIAFFVASILLGLMGGAVADFADSRGWLKGQTRIVPEKPTLSLGFVANAPASSLDLPVISRPAAEPAKPKVTPRDFLNEAWDISKRLLPLFFAFTFIGYLLNGIIPVEWISGLFGAGHSYGIPLAATLGLPFYLNTEASLPLVRAMLDSGMSEGAALAFLITGAGTSIGAISGALTIARWRVIAIVIGTLWVGSTFFGFAYNLIIP